MSLRRLTNSHSAKQQPVEALRNSLGWTADLLGNVAQASIGCRASLRAAALLCILQTVLLGQSPNVDEPAIPSDPLELVTGSARPVQDAAQRAQIVDLVTAAQRRSNIRAQPYELKTIFTALGSGPSDGSWQMEDISPGKDLYRWAAQGPSFSVVHLYVNKTLYSDRSANSIPARLAQVRSALFFAQPALGPRASVRTATGNLDGSELVCVLVSHSMTATAFTSGRSWDEAEYCIERKSRSLLVYSPIPGFYVHYDYSKPVQFHDQFIPGKFTISRAGQTIIEAQIVSVAEPASDPSKFQPVGLNTIGAGSTLTPPWHYHVNLPAAKNAKAGPQIVVLSGMQNPRGRLTDIELVASTDSSLNNSALQYAAKWKAGPMSQMVEPGAAPQSHEIFLSLRYAAQPH